MRFMGKGSVLSAKRPVRHPALGTVILAFLPALTVVPVVPTLVQTPDPPTQAANTPGVGHGLVGHYYTAHRSHDRPDYEGLAYDDFQIPYVTKTPEATRIDSQLAFGWGTYWEGPRWWPQEPKELADEIRAVVWTGYIRFPKPGRYYLATISQAGSAVYINAARVAVNGGFGGVIPDSHFDYPPHKGLPRENPNDRWSYAVPVDIGRVRVAPIEIRLAARKGIGIFLYWVTPDSPKDSTGRQVAELVPSDVLYAEAPEVPPQPHASAAQSELRADFLDFPYEENESLTLTVRVADQLGNPMAGKRVHLSGVTSYGQRDLIEQPASVTDSKGVTIARVRSGPGYAVAHTSRFFATIQDDLVDVGQEARVDFVRVPKDSFLPPGYTSYYGSYFRVEPEPMRVGRAVTISAPLTNRRAVPYDLSLVVEASAGNIGVRDWSKIGQSKSVLLRPGETRQLSVSWVPTMEAGHVCFRVTIWGKGVWEKTPGAAARLRLSLPAGSASLAAIGSPQLDRTRQIISLLTPAAQPSTGGPLETRQQNYGGIGRPSGCGFDKPYWSGVEERGKTVMKLCALPKLFQSLYGKSTDLGKAGMAGKLELTIGKPFPTVSGPSTRGIGFKGSAFVSTACDVLGIIGGVGWGVGHACASDPPDQDFGSTYNAPNVWVAIRNEPQEIHPSIAKALSDYLTSELSAAVTLHGMITSYERYLGASAAGDHGAASRQYAAYLTYYSTVPNAFGSVTSTIDALVALLRGNKASTSSGSSGNAVESPDAATAGASPVEIRRLLRFLDLPEKYAAVLGAGETRPPDGVLAALAERAAYYRRYAEGSSGSQLLAPFTLENPHDRLERIEITIRRAAMPTEWKVSVVNAVSGSRKTPVEIEEETAGARYHVRLPAHGKATLATTIDSVGPIAQNGVARWAVEGRIGDEFLGGIVQELNVSALVSAAMETRPAEVKQRPAEVKRRPYLLAAVIGLLVLGVMGTLFWRFIVLKRLRR